MTEIENQSPALAWLAASLAMPNFFNQEMQRHIDVVNQQAAGEITTIDK